MQAAGSHRLMRGKGYDMDAIKAWWTAKGKASAAQSLQGRQGDVYKAVSDSVGSAPTVGSMAWHEVCNAE